MKALITGATGFIGRRLVKQLDRPVILSRDPEQARRALGNVEAYGWQPEAGPPPAAAFAGVEAVFNLAGESIAEGLWTESRKRRIRDSRILGTRHLVAALAQLAERPRVLVSASAIGYYGSRGDEVIDESAGAGQDFLAELCRDWEAEAARATAAGVRVATPRIGIVLEQDGGALAKMLLPFKLCLGGSLGNGRQWMSWVHLDDLVALLLHAARTEAVQGPINAVAPIPVTNREFTTTLAGVLGRPALIPAPAFALKLVLGELSEVLLGSQRVQPKVAEQTGYRFRYANLKGALQAIIA